VTFALPPLDVPTLLQLIAVASFTMAVALVAMRPQQRDGLGLWALGLALHGGGYVLLMLRGQGPDWASIVLANALLAGSMACLMAAVHQFHGRHLPWWTMALQMLGMALLVGLFLDHYQWRLVAASLVLALQGGVLLWALWRPQPPQPVRGAVLVTLGLALQVLLLAFRFLWVAVYGPPNQDLLQSGTTQGATFLTSYVVIILSSLGFVLMAKDRVDAANLRLATTDALTGTANRRALIQALDRDMALALRTQEPYAVLMLDIDHVKAVNDQYGHLAGDGVLRHVAAVLRQRLRAQDMLGRYGGEEFLVLMPSTDVSGALAAAEALRQAVAQTPCRHGEQTVAVTVSIGVCAGVLEPGDTWDQRIHAADQALYQAKQGGRNRVQWGALPRTAAPAGPQALPPAVL